MATDLGDPYPITVLTKDEDGDLATTSSVTVTVTLPDGSTTSPAAMTETTTGRFVYDYPTTVAGLHSFEATATGAVEGVYEDVFNVAASLASVVSLPDMRSHLRLTSTDDDEIVRDYLAVATDCAQARSGRIWVRTTVLAEVHDGGAPKLRLRNSPVLSITSVTENGTTVPSTGYVLHARFGWLYRGTTTSASCWPYSRQGILVSYVAGPPSGVIPPAIPHGVKEMVRHLWEARRGGSGIPRQGPDTEWVPILGYSVPRRVAELWDMHTSPLVG